MRINPLSGLAEPPADRHVNERRLFDVDAPTDRNSLSDLLYASRPPKWERLVHPAPETDPALLGDEPLDGAR